MELLNIRIVVDTITQSGETFDVNMVAGFTVINQGASDCTLHYQGGPALMTISKGTAREFAGLSGYKFDGTMQIKFKGTTHGMIEVVKMVTSTKES